MAKLFVDQAPKPICMLRRVCHCTNSSTLLVKMNAFCSFQRKIFVKAVTRWLDELNQMEVTIMYHLSCILL